MLRKEELKRYNRQIILSEIGLVGQEKLKQAKVLVIGAGGLGCPVLQYMAAAGVGEIGIIDDDIVDLSNLQRQILYSSADIGRKKSLVAAEKLHQLNPFVKLVPIVERLTSNNAQAIIGAYSLVIDGTDNFDTRYLINDVCVSLNKPWVFGAIFKFEGQVSVFNYKNGPTYRCVFPYPPTKDEVANCSDVGVIGVLPGLIGLYMANEAIKLICGIGKSLSGSLLIINALNNSVDNFKVKRTISVNSSIWFDKPIESKQLSEVYHEISLNELTQLMENKPEEVYLVDVREPYEFEIYNIGGVNIPLIEIAEACGSFPADKKIVLCCQTGIRSKLAIDSIKQNNKNSILFHVKDGIL